MPEFLKKIIDYAGWKPKPSKKEREIAARTEEKKSIKEKLDNFPAPLTPEELEKAKAQREQRQIEQLRRQTRISKLELKKIQERETSEPEGPWNPRDQQTFNRFDKTYNYWKRTGSKDEQIREKMGPEDYDRYKAMIALGMSWHELPDYLQKEKSA